MNWVGLFARDLALFAQEANSDGETVMNIGAWIAGLVQYRLAIAGIVAAAGIWLMLPFHRNTTRRIGGGIASLGGILFVSAMPVLGDALTTVAFWSFAGFTAIGAVATITARNPVYSAIWFAFTLLATGGLFLINGAQFLGVATVAVYAGAIVVTFLFVLMLSQPEGNAYYDRMSWGTLPSAFGTLSGIAFILLTSATIISVEPADMSGDVSIEASTGGAATGDLATGDLATGDLATGGALDVLDDQHVARLGGELFGRHLVAVQAAGTLLLAALVGALVIASSGKPRSRTRPVVSSGVVSGSQGGVIHE
ncbi:MAG: NADH-quinone oxidoreductase subunit J [Planctomycetales bacterium]|nr:NADH-quinone oxidoreductase subunit J [Planctomycetales bacterium]